MFKKRKIFLLTIIFFLTSCADSWDSIKRGLTGAKDTSTDEFLVQKKDPLVLPPDFENLPSPDEREIATEQITSIEKTLSSMSTTSEEISSSETESSTEDSLLKKIQQK